MKKGIINKIVWFYKEMFNETSTPVVYALCVASLADFFYVFSILSLVHFKFDEALVLILAFVLLLLNLILYFLPWEVKIPNSLIAIYLILAPLVFIGTAIFDRYFM